MLSDVLKWSPSPHIYSGEPPSPQPWNQQGTPGTDIVNQSESATSKPEGGGAHGLVGRPPSWAHQPSLSSIVLFSGPTCQPHVQRGGRLVGEPGWPTPMIGRPGLVLTLLKAPIYVLQAHGSCSFSLRVFPQGLSIHGTSVSLCLTKH